MNSPARLLGVLDPTRKQEFLDRQSEILFGKLIPACLIEGDGDFVAKTRGSCIHFEKLDIVVIDGGLKQEGEKYFTHLEPEQVRFTPRPPARTKAERAEFVDCLPDTAQTTWGIQAIHGVSPLWTGKNIKVAILDSGLDFGHESFTQRGHLYTRRSFVATAVNVDELGHGTACASIICGQAVNPAEPRIGVAPDVDLVVAKIFDLQGESPDSRTLAALNWALCQGCSIISMSIGAGVSPGTGYSAVFDAAAQAALGHNAVLIAGAGNDSRRSDGTFEAVNHPANCPHIMAVGAVDRCLEVADFSNRSLVPVGGEINLVAPGQSVLVAIAGAVLHRYKLKDGTSYAVPFVAGIAALWMQSNAQLSGHMLWQKLGDEARLLPRLPVVDGGNGLAQGPP